MTSAASKLQKHVQTGRQWWKQSKGEIGVAALVLVVAAGVVQAMKTAAEVTNREAAGSAINAEFKTPIIGTATTLIETTAGVYLVQGTAPIAKGEELTIETRKNAQKLLCVPSTGKCYGIRS